jgi:N-acyl-D-amino-acid deacylase
MSVRIIPLLVAVSISAAACAADYDIIIKNGRIADGTGNPSFIGAVGIKDGRIAAVGNVRGVAAEVIDASGLVVAPGFIDVHTHADDIAEQPLAENFVRMGVTTVVAGNCGSSTTDLARFWRNIQATNVAVNVATLVGHGTIRSSAMVGSFDRPPTTEELQKMKGMVRKAMEEGAVGLSTGLIYLPGVFAQTDEIVEIAREIAPFSGIYASHMRHEDTRIIEALDEVFRVAREAGVRAEVSHIKLAGPTAWGRAEEILAHIERAREEGLNITQDQYAYTASSTGISQLIPESARDGGQSRFLERIADPRKKAQIIEEMKKSLSRKGREDFSYAVIASYRHDRSLNGKNIVEASRLVRGSDSLDAQVETILEIQKNGGASGVFHGMSEDDLQVFMRHPNTMVACDSGLRVFGAGVPHPRGYGNNARVLARYVRDLQILRLEDAVRKMTSLPASTFQFKKRGLIVEGYWADITIFDPGKIQDTAQFNDPHHYPKGIPYVLVNGVPVVKQGEHTKAKAGHSLKHFTATGESPNRS